MTRQGTPDIRCCAPAPAGKYHRHHNALEVTPTGRWFTEQMLSNLMQARYVGPTGPQD